MGDEGDEGEITNAQYFSTRGCANDFSTRRYANAQYKCPMPNAQCPTLIELVPKLNQT